VILKYHDILIDGATGELVSSERIMDDPGICNHEQAMSWVNQLIIDLKKQLLGVPPAEPITMDRLNEWQAHHRQLEQCRSRTKFY
jgi:hypothetical protein